MAARNVLVLDKRDSVWFDFLGQFLEDTPSQLEIAFDAQSAGILLDRTSPSMAFVNPALVSPGFKQKLKGLQASSPEFQVFTLGTSAAPEDLVRRDHFDAPESLVSFQKKLSAYFSLPEKIRVLVVDNEIEIGAMIRDFLQERTKPSFSVQHTDNGKKGIEILEAGGADVLILDVKMPIMDGREVYRRIVEKNIKVPVIVFFDAVSGEEFMDIRKIGHPAVVEKGGRESAMPEMMTLLKKMVYFG